MHVSTKNLNKANSLRNNCIKHWTLKGVTTCWLLSLPVESVMGTFLLLSNVSSLLFFLSSTVTSFLLLRISCNKMVLRVMIV